MFFPVLFNVLVGKTVSYFEKVSKDTSCNQNISLIPIENNHFCSMRKSLASIIISNGNR